MFYLGIDISKAKLDCCLLLTPERKRSKTVFNSTAGFAQLVAWLKHHLPDAAPCDIHAVMEGTGVYHQGAATALHDAGLLVSVANPAQARDFAKAMGLRTKTDAVDSFALAQYGLRVQPSAWRPPAPHARVLQALLARHTAVQEDVQRERNRLEKTLVAGGVDAVRASLEKSLVFLQQQLADIEREINSHIDKHPDLKESSALLQSIPAVGPAVSRQMLECLHSKAFRSAEQLAAYLGLVPVERQSGTSLLGRARLSKAGPAKVRSVLYMAAIVATRHNPHVKAQYEALLKRGKCKMAALGAAMRKLVHLCFGVWKSRQPYNPKFAQNT